MDKIRSHLVKKYHIFHVTPDVETVTVPTNSSTRSSIEGLQREHKRNVRGFTTLAILSSLIGLLLLIYGIDSDCKKDKLLCNIDEIDGECRILWCNGSKIASHCHTNYPCPSNKTVAEYYKTSSECPTEKCEVDELEYAKIFFVMSVMIPFICVFLLLITKYLYRRQLSKLNQVLKNFTPGPTKVVRVQYPGEIRTFEEREEPVKFDVISS